MIAGLFRLVPGWVWLAIGVAIATMLALWTIYQHGDAAGAARIQARWDSDRAAYERAITKEREREAQVVTRTVIEYRDKVQIVKERGDEIVRQIPVLVPAGGCYLSGGFRVLHDAAASNQPPADPRSAAAAADPVEVSTAAETIAANYATCHETEVRLTALQQLVKEIIHADSHP